ncbi:hypothetical protein NPJ88_013805 [Halomonas elongata]|uniref:hypothetical protein n=1 Tax=Halomonas elongata TaxID=2746 RepID=UPI00255A8289|nr:hypothetical protein [Halomonas elongata]MDL4863412.1 hypothetical protein [Halomonas elongata]
MNNPNAIIMEDVLLSEKPCLRKRLRSLWLVLTFITTMGIGIGIAHLLKLAHFHHNLLAQLPDYDLTGVLFLLGIALTVSYKSPEGRTCFVFMVIGVAIMISCHFFLHGLPEYDRDDADNVSLYALFSGLFFSGFITSMTFACMGLLYRDKD